eukprot:CAMPEP_0119554598 /NCGR_PEP_ID=MMETSP1352-20130426/7044_1 /TAXON_ID=265584 /ORGANISM="Stauroneis constricta, Strain CCMP1120" /LENGTH=498 /DNA_ID=CAMNT_0007601213 /DNA_START=108 /DNA_END=1604 /DNA_ORIENTATION=-
MAAPNNSKMAVCFWLLLCVFASTIESSSARSATFTLFDNGASTGGKVVTLEEADFPVPTAADDEDDVTANELFAVDMTKHITVSKFSFPIGSVVATKAFREDGERIEEFSQLLPDNGVNRRVYLVAEGLEFVWPFIEAGHNQTVSPRALTPVDESKPIVLESMSDSPRVFKVYNMFSLEDADALIENAMSLTGDKAIKRSTVGNSKAVKDDGAHVESGRTSENAWDSTSPAAKKMITRSFNLTGIVENAGQIDGLQIVRYTPGQFYNSHPDYFDKIKGDDFDFNPYSGGSNRFATVFMYLNDVEEGGCTVFPKVDIANPTEPPQYALDMFNKESREHYLTKECHKKLALPPQKGTAALFYSITPDGKIDRMSLHGACPVIKGMKWGANIWIWNRQRYGDIKTGGPRSLKVKNTLSETVYISWEGKENGVLEPGRTFGLNTYEFHRFKAHLDSHKTKAFAEFTVQSKPKEQFWEIKAVRVHGAQKVPIDLDGGDEDEEL